MIGLAQLLGLADAVGASREVLLAIDATASAAAGLAAEVRILGGSRYTFGLRGGKPFCEADGDIWQLRSTGCPTASSIPEASEVVAEQAEALLYLAYKLQLPQLKQLMLRFLSIHWVLDGQALDGALLAVGVGSERVMEAAGATRGCQSNADSASCSKAQLQCVIEVQRQHHAATIRPLKVKEHQLPVIYTLALGPIGEAVGYSAAIYALAAGAAVCVAGTLAVAAVCVVGALAVGVVQVVVDIMHQ